MRFIAAIVLETVYRLYALTWMEELLVDAERRKGDKNRE